MSTKELRTLFSDLIAHGDTFLRMKLDLEKRTNEFAAEAEMQRREHERASHELEERRRSVLKQLESQTARAYDNYFLAKQKIDTLLHNLEAKTKKTKKPQ